MKVLKNLKNIALAALASICIWQAEFKQLDIPKGKMLVDEGYENVRIDTVIETVEIIDTVHHYITEYITPEPKDDSTLVYTTEHKDSSIYIQFHGELDTKTFGMTSNIDYTLYVPKTVLKTQIIKEPVYITQPAPIIKPKSHLYLTGGIGGNSNKFIPSIGATLISKKQNYYGLDMSFDGKDKYLQFKMGYRLW